MSYKSKDISAARSAKRLATRAAFEVLPLLSVTELYITFLSQLGIDVPTLVYSVNKASSRVTPLTTIFPHQYSLYPFLPPRALSWLGHGGNLFRLRRVGEWLPVDARDNSEQNESLADRCGIAVNLAG
jgi:hypothetical protein